MNRKTDFLRKVQLFSNLGNDELEVIAKFSEYRDFIHNEVIFDEGDTSSVLYVITDGEVMVSRRNGEEAERDIAHFVPGESLGELSLFSDTPREATARAFGHCRILMFPAKSREIPRIAEEYSHIFTSILYKCIAIIAGRIRNVNHLISEKTPWIHDLRRKLYTDKLTGLLNKNYLDEDLRENIDSMQMPVSCIMLKPDRFKYVNDTYGHEAGDKVLRLISVFLQSSLRNTDMAIRYRGDEFGVIVQDMDISALLSYTDTIRKTLKSLDLTTVFRDDSFRITFSIGLAMYRDNEEGDDFVIRAHEKMLDVWKEGGDNILMESVND